MWGTGKGDGAGIGVSSTGTWPVKPCELALRSLLLAVPGTIDPVSVPHILYRTLFLSTPTLAVPRTVDPISVPHNLAHTRPHPVFGTVPYLSTPTGCPSYYTLSQSRAVLRSRWRENARRANPPWLVQRRTHSQYRTSRSSLPSRSTAHGVAAYPLAVPHCAQLPRPQYRARTQYGSNALDFGSGSGTKGTEKRFKAFDCGAYLSQPPQHPLASAGEAAAPYARSVPHTP
eukprot:3692062-Rhodomonas_salina.1